MIRLHRIYLFILAVVLFTANAYSTSLYKVLDRHLVRNSDIVFLGQVISVEYYSYPSEDPLEAKIPHTLVRCQIEQVFKGKVENSAEYVLRFAGGPTEDDPGLVLHIDGVPLFDKGDRGIFFVQGNGTRLCPLVGWRQGFSRFIGGKIYTDFGNDVFLSSDPILAARIHPMDICDYDAFMQVLAARERQPDQIIFNRLSEETKLIIQDKENIQKISESQLSYVFPSNNDVGFDLVMKLIPFEFRLIPKTIPQVLIFRDLNILISQRHLFSANQLDGIPLRKSTVAMLQKDQKTLPIESILLLNRRVLEDLYPTLLTKSMDQTIVDGLYNELDEIMANQIGYHEMRIVARIGSDAEKLGPQPDPPDGERLTPVNFVSHIQSMVQVLHTDEELQKLPPALSVNIQDQYILPALAEVGEQ